MRVAGVIKQYGIIVLSILLGLKVQAQTELQDQSFAQQLLESLLRKDTLALSKLTISSAEFYTILDEMEVPEEKKAKYKAQLTDAEIHKSLMIDYHKAVDSARVFGIAWDEVKIDSMTTGIKSIVLKPGSSLKTNFLAFKLHFSCHNNRYCLETYKCLWINEKRKLASGFALYREE